MTSSGKREMEREREGVGELSDLRFAASRTFTANLAWKLFKPMTLVFIENCCHPPCVSDFLRKDCVSTKAFYRQLSCLPLRE